MNLSPEDKNLLQELCEKHDISFKKVLKLMEKIQEYEFKERRKGIYDALREIIKSDPNKAEAL